MQNYLPAVGQFPLTDRIAAIWPDCLRLPLDPRQSFAFEFCRLEHEVAVLTGRNPVPFPVLN